MVTRRLGLLRPAAAGAYLASLAPSAASLPRGPLRTLDDFYLANRAGRWSAAARQAYLIREPLVQPFFGDQVVRAARAVPLPDRITDRLHRGVLAALCPELLDLPLAGSSWKSGPRTPPVRATANAGAAAAGAERPTRPTRAARRTGGGPTGTRWPGCSAITPWTWAPRAGCSRSSGGRRPSGRCPAAGGLARRLGPGHPGRAAVGRLAERPRR